MRAWLPTKRAATEEAPTKRQGRAPVVNSVPGLNGSLLHVHDKIENRKWLVDGGAFVSLIPPTKEQRDKGATSTQLQAANGSSIPSYGSMTKTLLIGRRNFTYDFIN